jgi:hypothetical protein
MNGSLIVFGGLLIIVIGLSIGGLLLPGLNAGGNLPTHRIPRIASPNQYELSGPQCPRVFR